MAINASSMRTVDNIIFRLITNLPDISLDFKSGVFIASEFLHVIIFHKNKHPKNNFNIIYSNLIIRKTAVTKITAENYSIKYNNKIE